MELSFGPKLKIRTDQLLVARGLAESRSRAQALIMAGAVFSGEKKLAKAGDMLAEDAPLVCTDSGFLERVVANLVSNAVRVSAGTPVQVQVHADPASVSVLVVDRGPGVPPDQRERMFEPFQRLSDGSPGGLGLGLAVAHGLVTALGGTIEAEDTPGGGLTMVVTLPRGGPS